MEEEKNPVPEQQEPEAAQTPEQTSEAEQTPEQTLEAEQTPEQTSEAEQTRFKKFLDRLSIFHYNPLHPIRTWLAWLGAVLFVALVIAYYVTGGGR